MRTVELPQLHVDVRAPLLAVAAKALVVAPAEAFVDVALARNVAEQLSDLLKRLTQFVFLKISQLFGVQRTVLVLSEFLISMNTC